MPSIARNWEYNALGKRPRKPCIVCIYNQVKVQRQTNKLVLSTMHPLMGITRQDGKQKPAVIKFYDLLLVQTFFTKKFPNIPPNHWLRDGQWFIFSIFWIPSDAMHWLCLRSSRAKQSAMSTHRQWMEADHEPCNTIHPSKTNCGIDSICEAKFQFSLARMVYRTRELMMVNFPNMVKPSNAVIFALLKFSEKIKRKRKIGWKN